MKTCPSCGALVGERETVCLKCKYEFASSADASGNGHSAEGGWRQETKEQRLQARRKREELFRKRQEELRLKEESEENRRRAERIRRAELMKKLNINDIYEYDVVVLRDRDKGGMDVDALRETLASYGEEGWHLVNTITNELGTSSGNVTMEETILIFERCIKRASFEE